MTANTFTPDELEGLADVILEGGKITDPRSYLFVEKTNKELQKSIELLQDHSKKNKYQKNIREFSIQKQITILNDLKGTDREKDDLIGYLDTLHNNHLKTEKRTAGQQAEAVEQWDRIEKEAKNLPLLEYITSDDGKVRPEHKELDGIIRPVNDRFWSRYLPPLSYNCRCDTLQLQDEGDAIAGRPDQSFNTKKALKGVAPGLANNPAKSGEIFSKQHPYFNA